MNCEYCGAALPAGANNCPSCGAAVTEQAPQPALQPGYVPQPGYPPQAAAEQKSRVVYILLGIFLGGLGIHNFYAGRWTSGAIQLAITLLLSWLVVPIIFVWGWVIYELCTVRADGKGVPFQ